MRYVIHWCKNRKCDAAWIDEDLTNATTFPPKWKYCKNCCKELGINYEKQTPNSNLSSEQLEKKKEKINRLKKAIEEYKKNINSNIIKSSV